MKIYSDAPEETSGNATVDVDIISKKEDEHFPDAKYQGIQKKRRSDFKKHVHWASISAIYIGGIFYIVALFTWLYHLLAPTMIHFMPSENYETLQNLLFGSIVGALVSQIARKMFDD